MAVTKLLHIKAAGSGSPGRPLLNAICYVMNPEKMEGGIYVGGNSGVEPTEVYETMMDTKKEWEKPEGRQGYHFVLSWKPGETDPQTAYQMIEAFCEQYLGENYDYVFAVHTDQEHVHGHIIFNSVNRITGYKYRYQKGDWEKEIQPITDRICEEHGLAKLMYDKQQKIGKSYAEYQAEKEGRYTLKKIIQSDVDYMISCSDSWQDFLNQMEMLGYEFRMGYSNKLEREYMTFTVPGGGRRRDYQLDPGYRIQDIRQRIHQKDQTVHYGVERCPKIKQYRMKQPVEKRTYLSGYQLNRVKIFYRARPYYYQKNPFAVDRNQIRKDVLHVKKLREECHYLIRQNIRSEVQLKEQEEKILQEEKYLKARQRNVEALQSETLYLEYQSLQKQLREIPEADDQFEYVLDQLEEIRKELPYGTDDVEREAMQIKQQLAAVRNEKRIIRQIKRADRKGLEMQRGMERKMHGDRYPEKILYQEKVRK